MEGLGEHCQNPGAGSSWPRRAINLSWDDFKPRQRVDGIWEWHGLVGVLFRAGVDVQDTARHIDFVVKEAQGGDRPFVGRPDRGGIPFVGIPRDFHSI